MSDHMMLLSRSFVTTLVACRESKKEEDIFMRFTRCLVLVIILSLVTGCQESQGRDVLSD